MGVLKMDWHILVLERVPTLEKLHCEPFANVIFDGAVAATSMRIAWWRLVCSLEA